jgi:hypothetical protein
MLSSSSNKDMQEWRFVFDKVCFLTFVFKADSSKWYEKHMVSKTNGIKSK